MISIDHWVGDRHRFEAVGRQEAFHCTRHGSWSCQVLKPDNILFRAALAMPIKRISAAACLAALEAARKAGRIESADDAVAAASNIGHGPLIACARRWGSAAWVFEGRVFNHAMKT